ncbi:OmpA family protein, partial [Leptospira borgpetersenii serovar Tarassovi]|nr:OmpA family protein [Leptospira borgpetersenii serovar Tarassovi]
EKHTIEYIRENYKFTEKSDEWFRTEIRKWATEKVQETNNEGAGESIVVDEEEAPNENFPSSWGKDKNDGTSEIPAKDYTNYIPTPSAKPHLKRDKTVPILIFLIGLLVLTGLIYFFWTLFSSENKNRSNELGKTKINVAIVKGKEKSSSVSKMKKTVTEPNSEKLETVKGTIAKVEPKFSWFEKKHELSSNP